MLRGAKKCEKKIVIFSFSRPYSGQQDCVFGEVPTYAISVSLTIEIHKNNIDISRFTKKQYYIYYRIFPEKLYQTIFLSLSDVNLF